MECTLCGGGGLTTVIIILAVIIILVIIIVIIIVIANLTYFKDTYNKVSSHRTRGVHYALLVGTPSPRWASLSSHTTSAAPPQSIPSTKTGSCWCRRMGR